MIPLKKGVAFSGMNFDPVPALLINPLVPWNPQRNDPKSPIWKIPGVNQCMGNSVQNTFRFFAKSHSNLKTLLNIDTYSYYHGLELWLGNKIKKSDTDIYSLKLQSEYVAEIFQKNNTAIKVNFGKANVSELIDNLLSTGNIAIFGISVPRQDRKNFNHIMNIVGITADNKGFVALDSYGYFPYSQRFGYCVVYAIDWIKKFSTNMIIFTGV